MSDVKFIRKNGKIIPIHASNNAVAPMPEKRGPGRPRIHPLPDPNAPKRGPGRPAGSGKKKDEQFSGPKSDAQAFAYIGTGLGVGVAAGLKAAAINRQHATQQNLAREAKDKYFAARSKASSFAEKLRKPGPGKGLQNKALRDAMAKARGLLKEAKLTRRESIRLSVRGPMIAKGGAAAGASLIGAGVYKVLSDHSNLSTSQKTAGATGAGIGSYFGVRAAYNYAMQPKGVLTSAASYSTAKEGSKVGRSVLKALKHAATRIAIRGFKLF